MNTKVHGQIAQTAVAVEVSEMIRIIVAKALMGATTLDGIVAKLAQPTKYASISVFGSTALLTINKTMIGKTPTVLKTADIKKRGQTYDLGRYDFTQKGDVWQIEIPQTLLASIIGEVRTTLSVLPGKQVIDVTVDQIWQALAGTHEMGSVKKLTKAMLKLSAATVTTATTGMIVVAGDQRMQIEAGGFAMINVADGRETYALAYVGHGNVLAMQLSKGTAQTLIVTAAAQFDVLGGTRNKIATEDDQLTFGSKKIIGDLRELQTLSSILFDPRYIGTPVQSLMIDQRPLQIYESSVLAAIVAENAQSQFRTIDTIVTAARLGTLPGFDGTWDGSIVDLAAIAGTGKHQVEGDGAR